MKRREYTHRTHSTPVQPGVEMGVPSVAASVAMANGPSTAASRKILMLPRLYAMLRAKHRKYNSNVHTATCLNACSYLGRQCPTFGKVGEKG